MGQRTLYFENAAHLSRELDQIVIKIQGEGVKEVRVPIEDTGIIILEHPQITITHALLQGLMVNNTIVVTCDHKHMPAGILQAMEGHTLLADRYHYQLDASLPLKKQLWQQTVSQKISNQAIVLNYFKGKGQTLISMANQVQSGDVGNIEGAAARYYWDHLLGDIPGGFIRTRDGEAPNNALNYCYAILRAVVCRSLVGSGLLPALGIHHRNKYNAFALADDMMEPYRPMADFTVLSLLESGTDLTELSRSVKQKLLAVLTMDVELRNERSPLAISTQKVAASLVACLDGRNRKLQLPTFILNESIE